MSDRICICGKSYAYPYLLVKHLIKCKCNNISVLQNTPTVNSNVKSEKIFNCSRCNKSFTRKYNMIRHEQKCIEHTATHDVESNNNNDINNIYQDKIKEMETDIQLLKIRLFEQLKYMPTHAPIAVNSKSNLIIGEQNTNNTNNNNGTINNITINNNIQNTVHVVYPFGYENISFLTDEEILEILKSSEGASMVLDKIYSNIENNNFMKFSKKEKTMSYIASPKDIKYCNDEQFITMLYEQAKTLLDRIFFQCYPNLSNEHQLIVWDNVRTIKESLSNKSGNLKDSCINIITSKVNNSEEKRIYKEIKDKLNIKDKIQIDKIEEVKKNIEIELYELEKNMITKNLNLIKLKEEIWGDIMSDESMDFEQYENDLRLLRYINTYRYNKIKELNKLEYDSILAIEKLTIGDLESIIDMRNARNQNELQTVMMKNQELPKEYIDEIQNTLIDKPKRDNTINLSSVRLKNRNRHRRLKNSHVHVPLITN